MQLGIPSWLRITFTAVLITASTVVHVVPLFLVTLIKALLPFAVVRRACNPLLTGIAESWIGFNSRMMDVFNHMRIVLSEQARLHRDGHYLVLANHQSWVDIPVLQKVLNRRIPLLRFFLKSQLFWVPLLGLAWWALDFPFMKRYSRQTLAKHPELAGRDVAATRRSCARFRTIPVALMNFVEGTRFTDAKRARQSSPFRHLLKPKSGGIAFVLDAMGGGLQAVIDVTVVYPAGKPTIADLLGDRIPEVRIDVRERSIPPDLIGGDYENDRAYRVRIQAWMNKLWSEKDAMIERLAGLESNAG